LSASAPFHSRLADCWIPVLAWICTSPALISARLSSPSPFPSSCPVPSLVPRGEPAGGHGGARVGCKDLPEERVALGAA
jgi:hypothetical protein